MLQLASATADKEIFGRSKPKSSISIIVIIETRDFYKNWKNLKNVDFH